MAELAHQEKEILNLEQRAEQLVQKSEQKDFFVKAQDLQNEKYNIEQLK